MILPDLNLLLYAYNPHVPQHEKAASWWQSSINSDEIIALPYEIIFGFIRIATNKRLGNACVPLDRAKNTVDAWLALPQIRIPAPDPNHYKRVIQLMKEANLQGAILSDAILASYAIHHAATLCSNDSDFSLFSGLSWMNPLTND